MSCSVVAAELLLVLTSCAELLADEADSISRKAEVDCM